jgi:hypothetical protein
MSSTAVGSSFLGKEGYISDGESVAFLTSWAPTFSTEECVSRLVDSGALGTSLLQLEILLSSSARLSRRTGGRTSGNEVRDGLVELTTKICHPTACRMKQFRSMTTVARETGCGTSLRRRIATFCEIRLLSQRAGTF